MNPIKLLILVLISLISASSCHNKPGELIKNAPSEKGTLERAEPFAGVRFASARDTSCGMPLTTIRDTVHFQNRVYGFCSKACKEDFVTRLKQEHKR